MHIYRCFFLNEGGHIRVAELIEVEGLGGVIDKTSRMLQERLQH